MKRKSTFIESLVIFSLLGLVTLCFGEIPKKFNIAYLVNNGGLNTKASSFALKDSESPNCQNVYFGTEGGIKKRSGFAELHNTTAVNATSTGLFQYTQSDGTTYLMRAVGAEVHKSDSISSVSWDNITGAVTVTAGHLFDFDSLLNTVIFTNNQDVPVKWAGTGNVSAADVPTDLTKAKWVTSFKNYFFYANCYVDSTERRSRIYWSGLKDPTSWNSLDFIDVYPDDGDEVTGVEPLGDRLVVFKDSGIYNILYTGDPDIPFIVKDSESSVGCASGYSVQGLGTGIVFMSFDGLYFYDGNYATVLSDKIDYTFANDFSTSRYPFAVSTVYDKLNQYWLSLTAAGGSTNSIIIVWDYYNNAMTRYSGINASTLATVYVSGDERLYSGNYSGFTYRQDSGLNDDGVAITAYYWTKWFDFGVPGYNKRVKHVTVYLEDSGDYSVNVGYNYNFSSGVWRNIDIALLSPGGYYVGAAYVGTAYAAGEGGIVERLDITGSGKVFRLRFYNAGLNEEFHIRGFVVDGEVMGIR